MKCIFISTLITFAIGFGGCGKNCKEAKYQFSMEESFSPEKDSIRVGDTLWVSASHSTTFTDAFSKAQVDFSNSNIASTIRILNFPDTSQFVVGGGSMILIS
jgi:hypothetical protein